MRKRPWKAPLMYQSWRKLLFIHWQLPLEVLRQHVPERLQVDTFEGAAWISITPFSVTDFRPAFFPALPGLSSFNEINVRTYVLYDGVPGVWFFSLDCDSLLSVLGARTLYRLPYRNARMSIREEGGRIFYSSSRIGSSPADFEGSWLKGNFIGQAEPHSLDFFLVERYCLYSADGDNLYRARIFHPPWDLHKAEFTLVRSTMIEAQGLPMPVGSPLVHYSEVQNVAIWPLKRIV